MCISYNCFVNLDVSKFIKGSKLAPRQQQWWQRVRPKFSMALSPSLFGFFLPLLDWNFEFFIRFAGAFVVWVCWGFCFVVGCTECLDYLKPVALLIYIVLILETGSFITCNWMHRIFSMVYDIFGCVLSGTDYFIDI